MKYVLGLGSNLGDPLGYLRAALHALGWGAPHSAIRLLEISPIYESDAMLPEGAPAREWSISYLNLAVLCESRLSPPEMLSHVKSIEARLGRKSRERWAPREVDIDILAYQGPSFVSAELRVPHAGLLDRPFALLPLSDVVPNWMDAASGRSYEELAGKWRASIAERVPFRTRRSRKRLVGLVGILNVTPDSFSDGGRLLSLERLLASASDMIVAGAETLDLGAESTRPGATPINAREEWARLGPALDALLRAREERRWRVGISVDTRHFETARSALASGADSLNDVSGLADERTIGLLACSSVSAVVMHSLTIPARSDACLDPDRDPVAAVAQWAEERLTYLESRGLPRSRALLDPGIGFGKSAPQSWELIRRLGELNGLGCALYVGHSRKGFLSLASDRPSPERDLESAVLSVELAKRGVRYLRIHDVAESARALATESILDGRVMLKGCR